MDDTWQAMDVAHSEYHRFFNPVQL